MSPFNAFQTLRRRRAIVAPLVAVIIVVLLTFAALAVDLGYIAVTASELQRTCDASALAGASKLPLGNALVYGGAVNLALRNPVAHAQVASNLGVAVGHWEANSRTFTPALGTDVVSPNAVQVLGFRNDLALFFAPVIGVNTSDVDKEAIALFGSGRCAGLWGLDGVTVDGSVVTDSYDSSQGAYGPGNIYANGDLCSCENLIVNGGIEIHGDAMYAYGHAFIPSGTSYQVWGAIDAHVCDPPTYNADFDDAAINNDNGTIGLTSRGRDPFNGSPWDLYVTGNDSLTLNGGTYYFTSVLIDGQATLDIAGPTIIYVTGDAVFTGGGLFNLSQYAPDLVIYSSGSLLNLSGNADFYGGVIAPNTDVLFEGTSVFYGMILAKTLDFDGNAEIHVDQALVDQLLNIEAASAILVK